MREVSLSKTQLTAVVTLAIALGISQAQAGELSDTQPIAQLRYDANADYLYLIGAAPWGAPSCPYATYAQVTNTVPGRKQLLAVAMAAKLAGASVRFQGECASHPNYFNVTQIIVEQ